MEGYTAGKLKSASACQNLEFQVSQLLSVPASQPLQRQAASAATGSRKQEASGCIQVPEKQKNPILLIKGNRKECI
ncbi:MAG: hypothetical protein PVG35_18575 [Desulfobacterales bacterium]|jgi:hypothetical protein